MIELKTFDKSRVNPVDDGVLYNALAGESGILTGCGLTAVGGAQVQIRDGYLILCGRVCKVSQEVLHANLSENGTQEGQLVAAINLSNAENPIKLETRLPKGELMQGDINAGGTVYELEIATYTADELSVKSITTTANKIGLANKAALEAVSAELANKANIAALGQPSGIATLDGNGKLAQMPTAADVGAVPTTRTVNGKPLSGNITLSAADVGAFAAKCETLYEGVCSTNNTTLTLKYAITNYKLLIVTGTSNQYGTHWAQSNVLPVGESPGEGGRKYVMWTSDRGTAKLALGNVNITFKFTTADKLITIEGCSSTASITGVFGIK